ncbi:uncharacterized protein LOC131622125 [Vicia villosa]|uniref:uncharacterized protein LOC131622125 n=1 Tax=Vicia villosa TaxID=3911 RepID=UPI00273BD993|nr:uncharacterized protein LOC131622125 [Vicia villosa]
MGSEVNSEWVWNIGVQVDFLEVQAEEKLYTAGGGYGVLRRVVSQPTLNAAALEAANQIWRTQVPSKVQVFGWKCIQDIIATRDQLDKRGILSNNMLNSCALCNGDSESVLHLFVLCPFANTVWQHVCSWMGIETVQAASLIDHLNFFSASVERKVPVK